MKGGTDRPNLFSAVTREKKEREREREEEREV